MAERNHIMMLTIDTSGTLSGLAITQDQRILAELQWQSGRRHSEQVLPQLDSLCQLVEVTPPQFTHIAVALGPGSWSGIRVGISIAKGLAIGTNATIIGVASLDALAWERRGTACTAALSLGRGRFAVAHYPAQLWTPGTVPATNQATITAEQGESFVCDNVTAQAVMQAIPNPTLHIVWPRPFTYALIATELLHSQDTKTFRCEPIYLGDAVQRQ
jgi:tRNA threonylcarbamoyl adenosine modification protein YeaZ